MNDALLFQTIIGALRTTLGDTLAIRQNNQPSTHGRPNGPAVLLENMGSRRIGSLKREDVPDLLQPDGVLHTERQAYETTFQCNALAEPPAADGTPPVATANDLVNLAAAAIQSDAALAYLIARDVNVLRVTTVRNPKFMNDRGQFEASPSFDFIVTHTQIVVSNAPSATIDALAVVGI